MNILIVYDTVYGNTKEIADILKTGLEKDHSVIIGEPEEIPEHIIKKSDFIIIGSPIHYWRQTSSISRFLTSLFRYRIIGKAGVVFETQLENMFSGSAKNKISKMLFMLKFSLIGKGESFFVESVKGPLKLGEISKTDRFLKRIDSFVKDLKTEIHTPGFVLNP